MCLIVKAHHFWAPLKRLIKQLEAQPFNGAGKVDPQPICACRNLVMSGVAMNKKSTVRWIVSKANF